MMASLKIIVIRMTVFAMVGVIGTLLVNNGKIDTSTSIFAILAFSVMNIMFEIFRKKIPSRH